MVHKNHTTGYLNMRQNWSYLTQLCIKLKTDTKFRAKDDSRIESCQGVSTPPAKLNAKLKAIPDTKENLYDYF
jgi:hypothetical protein